MAVPIVQFFSCPSFAALPRSNIAFKGTRFGEAFLGSRVPSAQGRCSGFMVGVPLNLTLGFTLDSDLAHRATNSA